MALSFPNLLISWCARCCCYYYRTDVIKLRTLRSGKNSQTFQWTKILVSKKSEKVGQGMKWKGCYGEAPRLRRLASQRSQRRWSPGVSHNFSEGSSSSYILTWSGWCWLWPSDLQNYERIGVWCFRPQRLWQFVPRGTGNGWSIFAGQSAKKLGPTLCTFLAFMSEQRWKPLVHMSPIL